MTDRVPPLYWHPWYSDKPWLLEWLESPTPSIRVPVPPPRRPRLSDPLNPDPERDLRYPVVLMLKKRREVGLAPYVGDSFVYVWWVATDDYGKSIAGESRIHHTGDFMRR